MDAYRPDSVILDLAWTDPDLHLEERVALALLGTYADASASRSLLYVIRIDFVLPEAKLDRAIRRLARLGFVKTGEFDGKINEVWWSERIYVAHRTREAAINAARAARLAHEADRAARRAARKAELAEARASR